MTTTTLTTPRLHPASALGTPSGRRAALVGLLATLALALLLVIGASLAVELISRGAIMPRVSVAGVELGGLTAPPNYARAGVLLTRDQRMFGRLNDAGKSAWMGFRPSMPDSVPVISASTRHRNAFFGFGHGHVGLTLGAVTGRILADLVAGRDPGIDMHPFRIDRF